MTTPVETVRTFYSAIAAGDAGKMVELMTSDIEWISVVDFNVQEKGPAEVMTKDRHRRLQFHSLKLKDGGFFGVVV